MPNALRLGGDGLPRIGTFLNSKVTVYITITPTLSRGQAAMTHPLLRSSAR